MTGPALDPALRITLRAALSLLFIWSAGHKLHDTAGFRAALANYELVPERWLASTAALLVAAELCVAVSLWLPGCGAYAACAGAGLLALYAGAIAINIVRGRRDIDCGCAGVSGDQPLSVALVVRNCVLGAAALASALPAALRALTWVDGITIFASVVTVALLYAALDGLLVTAPRIRALARVTSHQSRVTSHA
jgi:hypothetical protein